MATPSRSRDSPAISGPSRTARTHVASINRRVYLPAAPELDGKTLPVGFGVAVNATEFENLASQVALGGKSPRRAHGMAQRPRHTRPNGTATS